jgi:hypothetical protein
MALTTHPHVASRLKKAQSYTSAPQMGLYGLFYSEIYLLYRYKLSKIQYLKNNLTRIKTLVDKISQ